LVLTTTIVAALGYLLDRGLGTVPVFAVLLGAFACGYCVWKIVNGYGAQMARHQQARRPLRRGEGS
jgi:hypothetical protein